MHLRHALESGLVARMKCERNQSDLLGSGRRFCRVLGIAGSVDGIQESSGAVVALTI